MVAKPPHLYHLGGRKWADTVRKVVAREQGSKADGTPTDYIGYKNSKQHTTDYPKGKNIGKLLAECMRELKSMNDNMDTFENEVIRLLPVHALLEDPVLTIDHLQQLKKFIISAGQHDCGWCLTTITRWSSQVERDTLGRSYLYVTLGRLIEGSYVAEHLDKVINSHAELFYFKGDQLQGPWDFDRRPERGQRRLAVFSKKEAKEEKTKRLKDCRTIEEVEAWWRTVRDKDVKDSHDDGSNGTGRKFAEAVVLSWKMGRSTQIIMMNWKPGCGETNQTMSHIRFLCGGGFKSARLTPLAQTNVVVVNLAKYAQSEELGEEHNDVAVAELETGAKCAVENGLLDQVDSLMIFTTDTNKCMGTAVASMQSRWDDLPARGSGSDDASLPIKVLSFITESGQESSVIVGVGLCPHIHNAAVWQIIVCIMNFIQFFFFFYVST